MELRWDEIGVDSLIAVEMRSWFLQNYEANIPVLSILGGVSLADLVNQAVREMPEHLAPSIVSDKEDGMPLETNRRPHPKANLLPPSQYQLTAQRHMLPAHVQDMLRHHF
jgi:hypothetical protein